jgi:hypothetical protein
MYIWRSLIDRALARALAERVRDLPPQPEVTEPAVPKTLSKVRSIPLK